MSIQVSRDLTAVCRQSHRTTTGPGTNTKLSALTKRLQLRRAMMHHGVILELSVLAYAYLQRNPLYLEGAYGIAREKVGNNETRGKNLIALPSQTG